MTRRSIVITLLAVLCIMGSFAAPASAETLGEALDGLVEYYADNKPQPDHWEEIVALGRAGVQDVDLSKWIVEFDDDSLPLDYASTILGLTAAGLDPRDYNGTDLVDQLVNMQLDDGSFGAINNTIYSIIALDQVNAIYDVDGALSNLISQQNLVQNADYGGFGYPGWGYDPDTTSAALMALAKHKQSDVNAQKAVGRAIVYLHNKQLANGGFGYQNTSNAASTATVIQGLVACGEDIVSDWNKGNNNIINALFDFRLPDGSFCHQKEGGSDDFSTRQALVAVAELANSGYKAFAIPVTVSIRVEGNDETLDSGTVSTSGTALDALDELVDGDYAIDNDGKVISILGEEGRSVSADVYTAWRYSVVRNGNPDPNTFSLRPDEYTLQLGDDVVFYIGAYYEDPLTQSVVEATYIPVVSITPTAPTVGQMLNITVSGKVYNPDTGDFVPGNIDPVVIFNQTSYTTFYGQVQIPLNTAGTVTGYVYQQHTDGYPVLVRSIHQLTVSEAVNKKVKVRVEGAAGKLASGEVEVSGTALDALKDLVGEANVTETGGYIFTIMNESENLTLDEDTSMSWKYYVIKNGNIDSSSLGTGAGSYNVKPGDNIVFYLGAYDSGDWSDKTYLAVIELQPAAPRVGDNVTVTVPAKKYDWSQGLIDQPVDDIKLIINGQSQIVATGQDINFTAVAGNLNIRAEKYDPLGYPTLAPAEVSLNVTTPGGGDIGVDTISVRVRVVGKNRELMYSGTVELAVNELHDAIYVLEQTPLTVVTKHNGRYVYSIDGIAEDSSSTAGWKYKVNGEEPLDSAKDYDLEDGDELEWFWGDASDFDGMPEELVSPVTPPERQPAVEQAKKDVAAALEKLAQQLPGLAELLEELFNRVELAEYTVIVITTDSPMTAEEREQWKEILDLNKVAVSEQVDSTGEQEVTDPVGEVYLKLAGGSLTGQTTIEIYELTGPDDTIPDTHRPVSPVYDLGPDGTVFNNPVILRIKIPGYEGAPENLVIAWYDLAHECWVPVPSVVDPANGEISGLITHFTKFAVLAREKQPTAFSDVGNGSYDWARKEIQYLAFKGIVSETGEGKFEPARPVTRGEFVIMLAKAMGIEAVPGGKPSFTDLQPDTRDYDIVQAAYAAGLVKGYDDGTLRAGEQITREQIAAMVTRALDLKATATELEFKDQAQVSDWSRESVIAVTEKQLLTGYPDGSFQPKLNVDRAQSAVLVYRIISLK